MDMTNSSKMIAELLSLSIYYICNLNILR